MCVVKARQCRVTNVKGCNASWYRMNAVGRQGSKSRKGQCVWAPSGPSRVQEQTGTGRNAQGGE